MAITCPKCGAEFDATLFEFGHRVRCRCGAEVEYPGTDLGVGHVDIQGGQKTASHEDRCVGCLLGTACGDIVGLPGRSHGDKAQNPWRRTAPQG
jgi:hypothetical protein